MVSAVAALMAAMLVVMSAPAMANHLFNNDINDLDNFGVLNDINDLDNLGRFDNFGRFDDDDDDELRTIDVGDEECLVDDDDVLFCDEEDDEDDFDAQAWLDAFFANNAAERGF